MENYLVVASIIGVVSQRLVRKICPNCAEKYSPTASELLELIMQQKPEQDLAKLFKTGKGCKKCNYTGYSGRMAIQEIIKMTPELREAIIQNKSKADLDKIIQQQGFVELLQDGLNKVLAGQTTLEELQRVAYNIID